MWMPQVLVLDIGYKKPIQHIHVVQHAMAEMLEGFALRVLQLVAIQLLT